MVARPKHSLTRIFSERVQLRQPQVSKHLHVLKEAGLVAVRPEAQRRVYELRSEPFHELHAWLEDYRQLWDARFDTLDIVIQQMQRREQRGEQRHERRKKK